MPSDCIQFRDTNFFSSLICDYLDQKPDLQSFYNHFPEIENFKNQIAEKEAVFSDEHRKVLVQALQDQYISVNSSSHTLENIILLKEQKTFTVVTGQDRKSVV